MAKQKWKAGNMVYPLPAIMVSCGSEDKPNIVTVAWTGTICTNPPMTYISLRPSRYSYDLIKENGYFVINLITRALVKATDFCGVRSGRDVDKFKEMNLTASCDNVAGVPMIEESPVNIVCKLKEIKPLGSHDLFIADVLEVYVDDQYMDEKGKFHLNQTDLIAYSHGTYLTLGEELGTFGYSVKKTKPVKSKQEVQRTNKSSISEKSKKQPRRGTSAEKKQSEKNTKKFASKKTSKGNSTFSKSKKSVVNKKQEPRRKK